MQVRESSVTTPDGVRLYYRSWLPDGSARGAVLAVHGMGFHSGWFHRAAPAFVARGWAVHAPDLRGHGQSGGRRVWAERFEDYSRDLDAIAGALPSGPLFVVAQSMGCLVSLSWIRDSRPKVEGIVVVSPWFRTHKRLLGVKSALGRLIKVPADKLALPGGFDNRDLTHDPEIIAAWDADPTMSNKITVGLAFKVEAAQKVLFARAGELRVPALFQISGADNVVDPAAAKELFQVLGTNDKTYQEYPGAFHELYGERERERAFSDALGWLDARAQRRDAA